MWLRTTATLQSIYRFPVKGLSPEPLPRVALTPGQTVPGDRLYAIENGPSGFDPAAPKHQPKMRYLMLMRNERLATLRTRFDDASHTLTVDYDGREAARGDLRTADGRAAIERFFASFSADDLRGPPKVLHAPGFSFSDVAAKVVSIINLASVADLENYVGAPIDPLRFRANLYVTGWPAWQELDMVGQPDLRDRQRRRGEDRQAHRALRRHQRRSRDRRARPRNPRHADEDVRPRRLRHLCRGRSRGGDDRGWRHA